MKTPNVLKETKPFAEFNSNTEGFLAHIHATKQPLVITQPGKNSAVLIDATVYDAMVERLEILHDIALATTQHSAGLSVPHERVRSILMQRLNP